MEWGWGEVFTAWGWAIVSWVEPLCCVVLIKRSHLVLMTTREMDERFSFGRSCLDSKIKQYRQDYLLIKWVGDPAQSCSPKPILAPTVVWRHLVVLVHSSLSWWEGFRVSTSDSRKLPARWQKFCWPSLGILSWEITELAGVKLHLPSGFCASFLPGSSLYPLSPSIPQAQNKNFTLLLLYHL